MPLITIGKASQAIGVDIGTRSIRVAEININKEPPVLNRVGFVKIPEGLVVDGEISDVKGVASALKDLWRSGGFEKRDIVVGIANQKVIVRVIDLPLMSEEELKGAIRFQAADYIPMPIEETIIDFEILKEFEVREGEKMMKVLLVAAQREMIQAVVDVFAAAGLVPKSIDVKSFALMRSLIPKAKFLPTETDAEQAESAVCLLNIGAGVSNMIVLDEGMPYFVRILMFGGNDFTKAIADQMDLSEEDAEALKVVLSEPKPGKKKAAAAQEKEVKAGDILRPKIQQFVREIRRSIDYCMDQTGCRPPGKIIVSGRGSKVVGLIEDLEKSLQIKVEDGKPLQNIKIGRLNLTEDQIHDVEPSLSVPIGLALKDVKK
jgi:type IV pilus assembly protein PilM